MENIKVSYIGNWDCEGYHTTQNIRLSEDLFKRLNKFACIRKKYRKCQQVFNYYAIKFIVSVFGAESH